MVKSVSTTNRMRLKKTIIKKKFIMKEKYIIHNVKKGKIAHKSRIFNMLSTVGRLNV